MEAEPEAVMLFARIVRHDGAVSHHRVLSLSPTTMSLAAGGASLLAGERVTATLGAIDRAAGDVAAVNGGVAAVAFHHRVDCAAARLRPAGLPRRPSRSAWLAAIEADG